MSTLVIAGFAQATQAVAVTGRLTDAGVSRQEVSLVTPPATPGREFTLAGDGVLSARLRLAGFGASLGSCLRWIGLDDEHALPLEALLERGGGLVVLNMAEGSEAAFRATGLLQQSASSLVTVKILGISGEDQPAVRVRTSVGESSERQTVYTLRERVTAERRPVRRPATEADLAHFQEAVHDFTETTQVLEVSAVPYVVEEMVVSVQRSLEPHEVEERVRKMRAELEEL